MQTYVLEGILLPEHKKAGLEMVELPDHFVQLQHNNKGKVKEIYTYNSSAVTIERMRHDATEWIKTHKGN